MDLSRFTQFLFNELMTQEEMMQNRVRNQPLFPPGDTSIGPVLEGLILQWAQYYATNFRFFWKYI